MWKKIWDKRSDYRKDTSLLYASGFEMIGHEDWFLTTSKFMSLVKKDIRSVVEIGCGGGSFLHAIKEDFTDARLAGCDICEGSICIASSNLSGVFLTQEASVEIEEFIQSFDLGMSFSVFQYFNSYEMANEVLCNMMSYIVDGGVLFIGDIPDKSKETEDIVCRKKEKRKVANHLYYDKDFFRDFASTNNLSIEIYDHVDLDLPDSLPNKEFRYSVIMRKVDNYYLTSMSNEEWKVVEPYHYAETEPFDMQVRLQNIIDVKKNLDDNDILFWICDGTLLGAVRENDFIKWDNETDVDMFEEDLLSNYDLMKDLFLSLGFIVRGHKQEHGAKMNIYRGREKISIRGLYLNPKYKNNTYRMSRRYQYPKKFFEKFDIISLHGVELMAPHPVKKYIHYVYGDQWKKRRRSKEKLLRGWLNRGVRRKSKDRRRDD